MPNNRVKRPTAMTKIKPPTASYCTCGSGLAYADCCERWHSGGVAPTAEVLMRSRYSAYVLGLEDYLLLTWLVDTRPQYMELEAEPRPQWQGLEVKRSAATGPDSAVVEFVARYKLAGKALQLHEISRFLLIEGQWYYVDGQLA